MRIVIDTKVEVSRDPDDDKFISCAVDAKALYVVSGDKDLLEVGRYRFVEIFSKFSLTSSIEINFFSKYFL